MYTVYNRTYTHAHNAHNPEFMLSIEGMVCLLFLFELFKCSV